MKFKYAALAVLLSVSVLLAGCSKTEDISGTSSAAAAASDTSITADTTSVSYAEDTDDDMKIRSIEGYYMRTAYADMIIQEQSYTSQNGSIETHYFPVTIGFAEGAESEVPMDSLKTGDKIEVDVMSIAESYPGQARIYGLRLIESGDVSDIDNDTLLDLESMGYHAVIGENTEEPLITRHSGYFVRTDTDCFLVPSEQYGMLSEIDILKINPAPFVEEISLDGFNTGDRLWVDIMLIQELYPPIAPIYGTTLIENGDISDIDGDVVSRLTELGYTISEEN